MNEHCMNIVYFVQGVRGNKGGIGRQGSPGQAVSDSLFIGFYCVM